MLARQLRVTWRVKFCFDVVFAFLYISQLFSIKEQEGWISASSNILKLLRLPAVLNSVKLMQVNSFLVVVEHVLFG